MNYIEQLQLDFSQFLVNHFSIPFDLAQSGTFQLHVDLQKQPFGDASSNAAMILAKQLRQSPRDIAQAIMTHFSHPSIERVELAGPGFLNAFFHTQLIQQIGKSLFQEKEQFFRTNKTAISYNIEFVSANPTGPLHLGHGRGGIIGDVLGNILRFIGHQVTKEYYINDAGSQIQKLGLSLNIRCQQLLGIDAQLPEDTYHGDYLITIAKQFLKEYGSDLTRYDDKDFSAYAQKTLLHDIAETLKQYGIIFDIWFSETSLHNSGAIAQSIAQLSSLGYLYEQEGALWFASTRFGDDKDRVVQKANGELTYVAADIAYMQSKIVRGADQLIMILGHDHHSYTVRLEAVRAALRIGQPLHTILYQLVKIKSENKQLKMSKRTGTMVTLRDVIDAVGTDVARFFYLHRKADAQLEFDIDLALKKNDENPVYYIQYAYVRTKSILQKAAVADIVIDHSDAAYLSSEEALLIKKIVSLKELLATISENFQTHLLTYYSIELADLFHHYYSHHRVIDLDNLSKTKGRLLLIQLLKNTFETIFRLMGISTPESM